VSACDARPCLRTYRNYNEKIKDLTDKFMQDAGEMKNRIHNLAVDKDREETRHDQEIGDLMDRCVCVWLCVFVCAHVCVCVCLSLSLH
jgi:hypothetical protein